MLLCALLCIPPQLGPADLLSHEAGACRCMSLQREESTWGLLWTWPRPFQNVQVVVRLCVAQPPLPAFWTSRLASCSKCLLMLTMMSCMRCSGRRGTRDTLLHVIQTSTWNLQSRSGTLVLSGSMCLSAVCFRGHCTGRSLLMR